MYTIGDKPPTEQEIKDLEAAHKIMFAVMALSNNTYCNLYKKYLPEWQKNRMLVTVPDGLSVKQVEAYKLTPSFKIITNLGVQILQKAKNWFDTQYYLEKYGHIPKVAVTANDFLIAGKSVAILTQASKYVKDWKGSNGMNGVDKSGIGIIPLIIWGVIAIVGAVSAAYIVSRLSVTTQDRVDLLQATKQTCIDLNLTPDQCANIVTSTQQEETHNSQGVTSATEAVGGSITKLFVFGLLAFFGLQALSSRRQSA